MKRILIVDDDEDAMLGLEQTLEDAGFVTNSPMLGIAEPKAFLSLYTPRILILDVKRKTVGLVEHTLRDSGFCAISSASVDEAISLFATGFFDFFIVIDCPAEWPAESTLSALVDACAHCESFCCWNVENIKERRPAFVEETMKVRYAWIM